MPRARLALALLLLAVPPAVAQDVPDDRLKKLEAEVASLRSEVDQLRKSSDDALFWLRLSDVAEVDKVLVVGPPNPRGKERYGIKNARHPFRFPQYVFVPKKLDRARKHPLVVLPHGGVHGDFGTYHVHILREMMEKGWVVVGMKGDWKTVFPAAN